MHSWPIKKKKKKNPKRKQRQHGKIKEKRFHMGNFVQLLHHFVSNLERLCFGGFGRKLMIPTKIFPIFHSQPNNYKSHFLCTFLSTIFHPSNNHSNQTEPQLDWSFLESPSKILLCQDLGINPFKSCSKMLVLGREK